MTDIQLQHAPSVAADQRRDAPSAPRLVNGSLVELPTIAGKRVARSLSTALNGGLLVAAVTGVLYGWGRVYYEEYLAAYGLRGGVGALSIPEVLFAPFDTVLNIWVILTGAIAGLGLVGMLTPLGSKFLHAIAAWLHTLASTRVQTAIRWLTATPNRPNRPEESLSDAQFYDGTRTAALGLLMLLGGAAVLFAGASAGHDGERVGKADLQTCARGLRGSVEVEGRQARLHLCGRIGEDLVMYDPLAKDVVVEKWDKQRVHAVPPR